MRCQVITVSIVNNLNQVTLLTQDLGQFELGGEYEVTLTPAAPLATPKSPRCSGGDTGSPFEQPAGATSSTLKVLPDLPKGDTAELAKERAQEALAALPPDKEAPVACNVCKGSGAVSVFEGDQNTGRTAACEACKGTGVQPLIPA